MTEGKEPRGPPTKSPPPRANYLALPSRDLGFLKNTLRLYLREEKVAEVVQAFGARCGAGQVVQSQVEVHGTDELAEVVPAMCAQIGLAKIRTQDHGSDHLTLELTRMAELPGRTAGESRWEFTRGFLEGAVAQLLSRRVLARWQTSGGASPDRAVLELRWTSVAPPEPVVAPTGAPETARPRGAPRPKGELPPGAFLVEEAPGLDVLGWFLPAATRRGGLAISAERGKDLRTSPGSSHLQVYDLTPGESLGLLSLEAGNLPAMLRTVDDFLKRLPGGVVLITDLPLLLTSNGVEPTRNFLSIVSEMLAEGKGTLLASCPRDALPGGDRSLLLRVLKVFPVGG